MSVKPPVILLIGVLSWSSFGCKSSDEGLVPADDAATGEDGGRDVPAGDVVGSDGSSPGKGSPSKCPNPPLTLKAKGDACVCPNECASGFCTDGVCCATACEGGCRSCNLASSPGTCAPVPAGMPPAVDGFCRTEPTSTCGFDGTCNGEGACRKHPDNTPCSAPQCHGNTTSVMVCAAGTCKAGPTTACSPFACDAATNQCFASCTTSTQCDGSACSGGSCGKKPLGAVCKSKDECQSGFCADGTCCNLACTGACLSCNQIGKMGQCSVVAVGLPDPHGMCKRESVQTCGASGLCNGQGGCGKYASGTVCKPGACSGTTLASPYACSGNGACVAGTSLDCAPYTCGGSACKSSCAADADCVSGNSCTGGSCGKKGNGQSCQGGVQCKSGFCVDGVCCDKVCTGKCLYCALSGSLGKCVPVPADMLDPRGLDGETDPASTCTNKGAASCGANGRCDGRGGCQLHANGTVCASESCDASQDRQVGEHVCQNGTCVAPAPTGCAPYKCSGSRCATSCGMDSHCTSPNTCRAGSCGKKPNGALCATASECGSDLCEQGVCCATACGGTCKACNVPGTFGTCAAVPDTVLGGQCQSGLPGVCAPGTPTCIGGQQTCVANIGPGTQAETCNAQDDNCNGAVDDVPRANFSGVAFSTLTAIHGGCTGPSTYGGACFAAINRLCQSRGCTASGFGPVEASGTDAWIACVVADPPYPVPYAVLTAQHPGCVRSAGQDIAGAACSAAIHRACAVNGFVSGFGPVEQGADVASVVCLRQSATVVQTTFDQLKAHHPTCDGVSQNWGLGCSAAIHRFCGASGYVTGFGPVEQGGGVAYVVCIAP